MKLEILKAAVHQQNYFHFVKTTSWFCPCFSQFPCSYLESFAVYLWLDEKSSQCLPFFFFFFFFLVVILQHQRVPLVTSPFGCRVSSGGGLELQHLCQTLASQFNFSSGTVLQGDLYQENLVFRLLCSLSGQHRKIPMSLIHCFNSEVLRQVEYAENQSQLAGSLLLWYCQLSLQNQIFPLTYTNIGSRIGSIYSI